MSAPGERIQGAETLFEQWTEFSAIFRRAGVPEGVIELCRHAFYSGGACTLMLITTHAAEPAHIRGLLDEVQAFRYDVNGGALGARPARPRA